MGFPNGIKIAHNGYDQSFCIGFVYKFEYAFYILIADLHQRLFRICFGTADHRFNSNLFYIVEKGK